MSIIAVKITQNKIKFIHDTRMVYADYPYEIEKAFKISNIIIGKSGNIKTDPYLKHFVENQTKLNKLFFDNENSIIQFIDKYIKEYKDNEKASFIEGDSILISDSKKVFYINLTSKNCSEIMDFEAIGSGKDYAIGAYKAGSTIEEAVQIACESNIYCGGQIKIIEVDKE